MKRKILKRISFDFCDAIPKKTINGRESKYVKVIQVLVKRQGAVLRFNKGASASGLKRAIQKIAPTLGVEAKHFIVAERNGILYAQYKPVVQ